MVTVYDMHGHSVQSAITTYLYQVEYVTEYSIWAIAGGQMVMATDPRNMTTAMKEVLFNKEVLYLINTAPCPDE